MIDKTLVENTYKPHFEKKLLPHFVKSLRLAQFSQKGKLTQNSGDTVRYFRPKWSPRLDGTGAVSQLTGANPSQSAVLSFENLDLGVIEYGQTSDVKMFVSNTSLLRFLETIEEFMSEDLALLIDGVIRNSIQEPSTATNPGFQYRYAQANTNFADLIGQTDLLKAVVRPSDFTQAAQILKDRRVPMIGGKYIAVISPAVEFDILNSPLWQGVVKMNDSKKIYEGEIGEYSNIKFVSANNPFIETSHEGTFGESQTPGENVYSTPIFGKDAFGSLDIDIKSGSKSGQGDSVKPKLIILSDPDKSDKLNQYLTIGWKIAYNAVTLNPKYGLILKSRSSLSTPQATQLSFEERLANAIASAVAGGTP